MLSSRKFRLYNGNRAIGTFELLDDADRYAVTLKEGLRTFDIPVDFMPEYQNGQRYFTNRAVFAWIADRVIPSGRQNIEEILRKMQLPEYDELGIFLYFHGKCTRDQFRIEEMR